MSNEQNLLAQKIRSLLGGKLYMVENFRPSWLRNPFTGNRLEIDLYIPSLKIGIEYQGFHHFGNNVSSEHHTDGVRRRDTLKRELAKKRAGVAIVEFFDEDLKVKPFGRIFFDRVEKCCTPSQIARVHKQVRDVHSQRMKAISLIPETDENGHYVL